MIKDGSHTLSLSLSNLVVLFGNIADLKTNLILLPLKLQEFFVTKHTQISFFYYFRSKLNFWDIFRWCIHESENFVVWISFAWDHFHVAWKRFAWGFHVSSLNFTEFFPIPCTLLVSSGVWHLMQNLHICYSCVQVSLWILCCAVLTPYNSCKMSFVMIDC